MHGRDLMAHGGYRCGRFFGADVEEASPASRVVVSAAVISSVALSAVFLAVVAPGMWWLLTTYGWIVFPAFGTLASGLSGRRAAAKEIAHERAKTEVSPEQQLLEALARNGEITAMRAALETSLSVAEAEEMLAEFARSGFIEVHVRGGGLFYSMWESSSSLEYPKSDGFERG